MPWASVLTYRSTLPLVRQALQHSVCRCMHRLDRVDRLQCLSRYVLTTCAGILTYNDTTTFNQVANELCGAHLCSRAVAKELLVPAADLQGPCGWAVRLGGVLACMPSRISPSECHTILRVLCNPAIPARPP